MKTLQNIDFKVLFDSSQDFSYFSDVHSTLSYFKTCLTRSVVSSMKNQIWLGINCL